jgi:branched-chain amino acid transport system permease protein
MSATQTTEKSAVLAVETLPRFFGTPARLVALAFGVALLAAFLVYGGEEWLTIANYTLIYAIATLGLNVLSGYTGQVSLGIAFFMSIGAYTAILLGGQPVVLPSPNGIGQIHLYGLQLPFYLWLPASGIVAALVGALVGPTALRLKGFYLGIVSLALVFIGTYVFQNIPLLSYGAQGRAFYTPCNLFTTCDPSTRNNALLANNPEILGIAFTRQQVFFVLDLVLLAIAAFFVGNVMRSRAGRAFQAVRDHEVGASIMGVNLFQAKMGAFILSSFLAGIAGGMYAIYTNYVSPGTWSLLLSIQFVAAIIIGGIASVWGSILGATFIFALPLTLSALNVLPENSTVSIQPEDVNAIIYGFLIIVFLLFEPGGIVGLIRRLQPLVQRFKQSRRKGGMPTSSSPESEPDSHFEVEHSALSTGEGTQPLVE